MSTLLFCWQVGSKVIMISNDTDILHHKPSQAALVTATHVSLSSVLRLVQLVYANKNVGASKMWNTE